MCVFDVVPINCLGVLLDVCDPERFSFSLAIYEFYRGLGAKAAFGKCGGRRQTVRPNPSWNEEIAGRRKCPSDSYKKVSVPTHTLFFFLLSSTLHFPSISAFTFHRMGGRSPITCHVLDSSCGKPGRNVPVKLEQLNPAANNAWTNVAYGYIFLTFNAFPGKGNINAP